MSDYVGGTFRCKICAKEFLTKEDSDLHYKENHSNDNQTILLL